MGRGQPYNKLVIYVIDHDVIARVEQCCVGRAILVPKNTLRPEVSTFVQNFNGI
jgi:hypothetical protein